MEEQLKKYGISKELFLKVTQFIKLQVDLNMVNTLTDQEQIAAEILIMASESLKANAGENTLPIQHVSNLVCDCIEKEPCSFTEHGKLVTKCVNCGGSIAN